MIRRTGLLLVMMAMVAAACSSASDTIAEQIIESGDGVTDVDVDGDQVTVEFDDVEGGGSIVIGGGEVPDGFAIDVPGGGEVASSFEQGGSYAVSLTYPIGDFDDLVDFYSDWVADQDAENVSNNSTTNPRSSGWYGETAEGQFAISLFEGADSSGNPAVSVTLSWTDTTS